MQDCSEEDLVELLGPPRTEELRPSDGHPLKASLPKHVVGSTYWDSWIDEDEEDIRLIDLGEAFPRGAEPTRVAQPFGLNAPETALTSRIDHKIDMWRAGCVVSTHGLTCTLNMLTKDVIRYIFWHSLASLSKHMSLTV